MCDVFHLNCRCRPRFDPDAEIQVNPLDAQRMLEPTASRIRVCGSSVHRQLVQFDVGGNSAPSIAHRAYQPTGGHSGAPVTSDATRGIAAPYISPPSRKPGKTSPQPGHGSGRIRLAADNLTRMSAATSSGYVKAATLTEPDFVLKELSHEDDNSRVCSAPGHSLASERSPSSGCIRATRWAIGIDQC